MNTWSPFDERACRVCGCTELNACVSERHGPCWWVEDDLCSHCDMKAGGRWAAFILVGILVAAALIALAFWLGVHQAWRDLGGPHG